MVRAALEGVAYTVASHVDIIEREHGLPIGRIMLVGGGTKNPVWMQTIADVCGREVSVAKVTVGACFGDAIMAALAGGAYASWDELAQSLALRKQSSPIWLPTSYMRRAVISLTNCMHATVISCTNWCNAAELYCLPIGAALCDSHVPWHFCPQGLAKVKNRARIC